MEKTYFDRPTQVVFADPDNPGEWLVGIAYKDDSQVTLLHIAKEYGTQPKVIVELKEI